MRRLLGNWIFFALGRFCLLGVLAGERPSVAVKRLRRFRLWVIRRLGATPKKLRLGIEASGDGGGAQLHSAVATFAFARSKGCEYLHLPLTSVEHAVSPVSAWVQRWNSVLIFPSIADGRVPVLSLDSKMAAIRAFFWYQEFVVLCSRDFRRFANSNPRVYEHLRQEIRSMYRPDSTRETRQTQTIVMSVHVRRGDVARTGKNSFRFTPNDEVRNSVLRVLNLLPQVPQITIYSNSSAEDMHDFVVEGWTVETEIDAISTFNRLVDSHELVLGKSSFSFLAGILTDGRVWYENFWHPPLPSWQRLADL